MVDILIGIFAALPVILASIVFIAIRSNYLWKVVSEAPKDILGPFAISTKFRNSALGIIFWAIVALIAGIIGVLLLDFLKINFGIDDIIFLFIAIAVSLLASTIVYRPFGDLKRFPFWFEWTIECLITGIGLGIMIPLLMS